MYSILRNEKISSLIRSKVYFTRKWSGIPKIMGSQKKPHMKSVVSKLLETNLTSAEACGRNLNCLRFGKGETQRYKDLNLTLFSSLSCPSVNSPDGTTVPSYNVTRDKT